VPVHETHEGTTVWDGEVQVFELVGHPKATRACAWSHATEGNRRMFRAVLGLAAVTDTAMAARTSVLAEYRSRS
jgi:hypothetical protein